MAEKSISLNVSKGQVVSVCQVCGKEFIHQKKTTGKHCSWDCRVKANGLTDQQKDSIKDYREDNKSYNYISKAIGSTRVTIQRFCASEGIAVIPHPNHVKANLRTGKNKKHVVRCVFVCLHCGCAYTHKRGDDLGFLFCSKHCSDNYRQPIKTVSMYDILEEKRWLPRCVVCGQKLNGTYKYCSNECELVLSREAAYVKYHENKEEILRYVRKRYREEKGLELRKVECGVCGKEFKTWNLRYKYCSKECADKASYEQCSDSRRDQRRRRRARLRGAIVEKFNSKEIFMRDGWRCQICKRKIRKNAKYPHPHSPTLDHIIPLARGGTHERKNVQLACFICNSKKSADVADGCDQLRMF